MKINNMPDKIASVVSYCVSGSLICAGGIMQWLQHLNWNNIAVIGGFVIGIATYLTRTTNADKQEPTSQLYLVAT